MIAFTKILLEAPVPVQFGGADYERAWNGKLYPKGKAPPEPVAPAPVVAQTVPGVVQPVPTDVKPVYQLPGGPAQGVVPPGAAAQNVVRETPPVPRASAVQAAFKQPAGVPRKTTNTETVSQTPGVRAAAEKPAPIIPPVVKTAAVETVPVPPPIVNPYIQDLQAKVKAGARAGGGENAYQDAVRLNAARRGIAVAPVPAVVAPVPHAVVAPVPPPVTKIAQVGDMSGAQAAGHALKKGATAAGEAAGSFGRRAMEFAGENPLAAGVGAGVAGALGLRKILQRNKQTQNI